MKKEIDAYFSKIEDRFSDISDKLREIYLQEGLVEELKWGRPCYSHDGLVSSIGAFKNYVGTWYFKGALLSDPDNRLRQAQKGTKGLRSLVFYTVDDLDEDVVRGFVKEAILLNKKGVKVPDSGKKKALTVPKLLQDKLDQDPSLNTSFESLSLSQKREYTEWIEMAKREETKLSRLEKAIEMIFLGIGRHDKYRK